MDRRAAALGQASLPLATAVSKRRRDVGRLLDGFDEAALLLDLEPPSFPVIGASAGYTRLTGFCLEDVFGHGAVQVLARDAPSTAVSRSAFKDLEDFCQTCRRVDVEEVAEAHVVQPLHIADGSPMTVLSLCCFVVVRRKPYALLVQRPLGRGLFVQNAVAQHMANAELCRKDFLRIKAQLPGLSRRRRRSSLGSDESDAFSSTDAESTCSGLSDGSLSPGQRAAQSRGGCVARGHRREKVLAGPADGAASPLRFYRQRLQDHCALSNGGRTAARREHKELQSGCLVFSERPVRRSPQGLSFAVRVDAVSQQFDGLPLLGFTRRRPEDTDQLYPSFSSCMGASVLIGTGHRAYARDAYEHFNMGFRAPPASEVQTWSLPKDQARRTHLAVGDVLTCCYGTEGSLQLWRNGKKLLDFDTGRPVDDGAEYFAVADVCLSAASLTLVPVQDQPLVHEGASREGHTAGGHAGGSPCSDILTDVRAPLYTLESLGHLSTDEALQGLSRTSSTLSLGDTESFAASERPDRREPESDRDAAFASTALATPRSDLPADLEPDFWAMAEQGRSENALLGQRPAARGSPSSARFGSDWSLPAARPQQPERSRAVSTPILKSWETAGGAARRLDCAGPGALSKASSEGSPVAARSKALVLPLLGVALSAAALAALASRPSR